MRSLSLAAASVVGALRLAEEALPSHPQDEYAEELLGEHCYATKFCNALNSDETEEVIDLNLFSIESELECEVTLLLRVLPTCNLLSSLEVSKNAIDARGTTVLSEVLPLCTSLGHLNARPVQTAW